MDWTGGTRKRFATGKANAGVQKQKAHFAKLRTAQQHARELNETSAASDHNQGEYPVSVNGESTNHSSFEPRERGSVTVQRGRVEQWNSTLDIRQQHEPEADYQTNSRNHPERSQRNDGPSKRRSSLQYPIETTTEEERLLLKRRHLLARDDWLGLGVTRPVQMTFPSSHNKDHIGRRRRVPRPESKMRPVLKRLLTPLFEDKLTHPAHYMSGALQHDDLKIRIGTEALTNQSQIDRSHLTSAAGTCRQPSTEFGPLSEEPMLLGDEGDMFDAQLINDGMMTIEDPSLRVNEPSWIDQTNNSPRFEANESTIVPEDALDTELSIGDLASVSHQSHHIHDEIDEKAWEHFIGTNKRSSTRAPISSSQKGSQAGRPYIPLTQHQSGSGEVSTPVGAGTTYTDQQSLSNALLAGIKFAAFANETTAQPAEDLVHDLVWRDFVLGRRVGTKSTHSELSFDDADVEVKQIHPASLAISGLGTSDEATVGDSSRYLTMQQARFVV